jgi:hypothetical protein
MESTTPKLTIAHSEQLEYHNAYLQITVLGGVRLDGLDRLRVTLKIALPENPRPPLRHNVDLYNDTQVEKLIRKTAERLEIGTSLIAATLAALTESLELYRLDQIKSQEQKQVQSKTLTEQEREEAENFLCSENLLAQTNLLIGQSGVIGEDNNRLLMYLIFTSRKQWQPLHVISLGSSGTGKTHLQEKVGQLIPEEDRVEITTLSENAFYYFGQRELRHRLILIEDLDGAEDVLYPLRELQSKRKISKTVAQKNSKGETRTLSLVVEGPVSVAGCTTKETIYEDNANRSFLLYLDESKEQDEKIMQYQRAKSAGKIDSEKEKQVQQFMQNTQRILQAVQVINPYAEQLKIPQEVFKPRRSNAHYLQFIEAITFYHQYQREQHVNEQTGEIFIETTIEDITAANGLLQKTLLRKSDQLSGACRNFFEGLKMYLLEEKKQNYTSRELRISLRIAGTTLRRYHQELISCGYIKIKSGKKETGFVYEIVSYEEYKNLQASVDTVLDTVLQNLQTQAPSPVVNHPINGAAKPKRINSKAAVNQSNA